MAFPASAPSYYANVSHQVRGGVYYLSSLNQAPSPPNVTWKVGSVTIKST